MAPAALNHHVARVPLAVILDQRRDLVLAQWTRRVLDDPAVPTANRLSRPALRDHIPALLDDVIDALVDTTPHSIEDASSELAALASSVRRPAQAHARNRLKNGYSLAQALRELTHFRAAVVDACTVEGQMLPGEDLRLLHGAIDVAMNTVAVEMERVAREHLEADQERLRQEGELRERFLAIVGHDLRTPLSTIVSGAGLLLMRGDATEAATQVLRRIMTSAERMGRMISDLLDLTRARESGGIPIARRRTDLHAMCRQMVEELRLSHPARAITFNAKGDGTGEWDPDRLTQVVQNLLGNALDYSPPETAVTIDVDGQEGDVTLTVKNVGEPIPPEQLTRIFEPFARGAHPAHASKGLGLGLFIANEIAKAHGGSIRVTSDPVAGTVFTVSLPRG